MSRFEISLPGGRTFNGESAGAAFREGKAEVDATTLKGRSQLAYFHGAGYNVRPLGDASVQEVLGEQRDDSRSALDEAAALHREIAELKAAKEIDALRKERDALYREVHGHDRAEDVAPAAALTPGSVQADEPHTPVVQPERPSTGAQAGEGSKLAPPQNDAPVAEWREWAVMSRRATETDVASMPRADIIRTHGKAYDTERAAELEKEVQA